jgi:hypothetical protein
LPALAFAADAIPEEVHVSAKILVMPAERLPEESARGFEIMRAWLRSGKVDELNPELDQLLRISPILGLDVGPGNGDLFTVRVDDSNGKDHHFYVIVTDSRVTKCIREPEVDISALADLLKDLDPQNQIPALAPEDEKLPNKPME